MFILSLTIKFNSTYFQADETILDDVQASYAVSTADFIQILNNFQGSGKCFVALQVSHERRVSLFEIYLDFWGFRGGIERIVGHFVQFFWSRCSRIFQFPWLVTENCKGHLFKFQANISIDGPTRT